MDIRRRHRFLYAATVLVLVMSTLFFAGCGTPTQQDDDSQDAEAEIDPNDTSPIEMTMAGASPSGYWRLLGESINSIVREEYPGSSVAYEPGSPAGAVAKVSAGRAELGVAVTPVEQEAAIRAEGPFEESLEGDFVGVMRFHEAQRMHSVMLRGFAEQHGIESFEDIAENQPPLRVSINQEGNYQNVRIAQEIFESYGFSFEDIEEWGGQVFFQASGDGIELLRDRRIDMYFNGTFIPDSNLEDAARALDLVWIDMDESNLEEIANDFDLATGVVEPGEYEFVTEETATIVWPSNMISSPDVPAQDIYKVVRAIDENVEEVRDIHPEMQDFSGDLMVRVQDELPLHPGAEQYYRDKGLLEGEETEGEGTE